MLKAEASRIGLEMQINKLYTRIRRWYIQGDITLQTKKGSVQTNLNVRHLEIRDLMLGKNHFSMFYSDCCIQADMYLFREIHAKFSPPVSFPIHPSYSGQKNSQNVGNFRANQSTP